MDKTYHGIYLPEGDGTPEVLFRDADAAQQYRKATYADKGVVMPTEDWAPNKDAKSALASQAPVPGPSPEDSALEQRRASVRSRIWNELADKRLEDEVRADTEKEFEKAFPKKGSKESAEDKKARESAEKQEEAEVRSRAAARLQKDPEKVTKKELEEQREEDSKHPLHGGTELNP